MHVQYQYPHNAQGIPVSSQIPPASTPAQAGAADQLPCPQKVLAVNNGQNLPVPTSVPVPAQQPQAQHLHVQQVQQHIQHAQQVQSVPSHAQQYVRQAPQPPQQFTGQFQPVAVTATTAQQSLTPQQWQLHQHQQAQAYAAQYSTHFQPVAVQPQNIPSQPFRDMVQTAPTRRPEPFEHPQFKLPVIPGVAPRLYLPQGTALVLEGGGTRGFYGAGVLDAFMDAGIMFPYIAAVSAGAANVLSYVSGQRGRNRLVVEHLVNDKRYLSKRNLIRGKSLFDYEFIFETVPQKLLFFDQQMFDQVQTQLYTGALDCREGKTIWYNKLALGLHYTPVIASCSIPMVSPMLRFDNRDLLDGGILDPIPIEKSMIDRNRFHVVVLTQDPSYQKERTRMTAIFYAKYHRKYPHLVWALQERHEAYNRQVSFVEQLERDGRALIIRPQEPVKISRTENSPKKLLLLYDQGTADGALAVDKLRQLFRF